MAPTCPRLPGRSAAHFVQVFREFYGPTHRAFAALPEDRRPALERAIVELLAELDQGGGRGLVVPSEYLETVITRG